MVREIQITTCAFWAAFWAGLNPSKIPNTNYCNPSILTVKCLSSGRVVFPSLDLHRFRPRVASTVEKHCIILYLYKLSFWFAHYSMRAPYILSFCPWNLSVHCWLFGLPDFPGVLWCSCILTLTSYGFVHKISHFRACWCFVRFHVLRMLLGCTSCTVRFVAIGSKSTSWDLGKC